MPESRVHSLLVESLAKWVVDKHLAGQSNALLIDNAAYRPGQRPPPVPNYTPDVYSRASRSFEVIVGEAKIASDLQTKHSEAQFLEFLMHCKAHRKSLLVVAVPWYATRVATRLLDRLKKTTGARQVALHIIEKLPG